MPHEHRWIRCHLREDYVVDFRCADCHMTPLEDLASRMVVDITGYLRADEFILVGDPIRRLLGLPMEGIR